MTQSILISKSQKALNSFTSMIKRLEQLNQQIFCEIAKKEEEVRNLNSDLGDLNSQHEANEKVMKKIEKIIN